MKISAVVLAYNQEKYIADAIDSVFGQTRQLDEILVVDDCSTDGTAALVKGYGEQVRYVRTPRNSGALLAALTGVKLATGDIVCMLDGDDMWDANKVEVAERAFIQDPMLVLLSHDHVRVDGDDRTGRDATHRNIASLRRKAKSAEALSIALKDTILDHRGYWLGSAYSFRRDRFDIATFEEQIADFGFDRLKQTYLDMVIAPFLVLTNPDGTVGYSHETRFFYRIHHEGSLSGNFTTEKAHQSAAKGRTINELINRILERNHAATGYLQRRRRILAHYDFLCALYRGQNRIASRLYARLALSHWGWRDLIKETTRFAAVITLGPQRFLNLKSRD